MLKGVQRLTTHFKYGEKGFTLIELLIAIAILGILIAVVVPNVTNYISSGKLTAANNELDMVKSAVLACEADTGASFSAGNSTTDLSMLQPYLTGTLVGSYSWDSAGAVIGTAYPATGSALFHWDGTKWAKGSPPASP